MNAHTSENRSALNLRAGDVVEVRSKSEILATLDANGSKEALPFMPEMLQHCGKKFRVYKRADKACDTVAKTGARRMENSVHLENVRCDGLAHGGCQAGCLIYWKEAWLKRLGPSQATDAIVNTGESPTLTNTATESRNSTAACRRAMCHAVENSSRSPSFAGCVIAACEKYERQKPWCHAEPTVSGSCR